MNNMPLTDGINALIRYANETTGASDTTLSDAVESLAAGYGGGGTATTLAYGEVNGMPLTAAINALLTYANEVTGAGDMTLSDAVATLVAGYSSSSWDYDWDYSKGLLTSNGWTLSGSGSEAMSDSGVVITGPVELVPPVPAMTMGVMEIDFIHTFRNSATAGLYVAISNGTNGAKFTIDRRYWRVCDKAMSQAWNMTVLVQKNGGTYTVRMEMGKSASNYLVNETAAKTDFPNSNIVDCTKNCIGMYTADWTDTITGIRYLINRLS